MISPSAITSPLPLCIDFLCVSYLLRLSTPVKTFLKTLRRLKHSPSKTLRSEVNFLSFFLSFFLLGFGICCVDYFLQEAYLY